MAEHNELTLDIRTSGGGTTVHCTGRLTVTSASQLRADVKRLLPQTRVVIIDLTNITLMDSVGLGTIAALYASARTAGCELQVVNISPRIREIFSVTRLLSLFEACGETNIRMP
jgi:anti-sigma B factor antagonist